MFCMDKKSDAKKRRDDDILSAVLYEQKKEHHFRGGNSRQRRRGGQRGRRDAGFAPDDKLDTRELINVSGARRVASPSIPRRHDTVVNQLNSARWAG